MYTMNRLSLRRGMIANLLLALCWCAGLFFGILAACQADSIFLSLMRGALGGSVSVTGLLAVLFLPFLISAFAVYIRQPWLMHLLCFFKAFSFGYCAWGIEAVFLSSGWLIRLLLMFSDLLFLPVLLWFWFSHGAGQQEDLCRDLGILAVAAVVIGGIDYCLISPFLAMLIEY